jgi:ADP-ribose pyrophosphatase YjhB (NUDIX family)
VIASTIIFDEVIGINTFLLMIAAASHQVGVGCVAFNDEGKLLAVQERTGGFTGIWKLPTGLVNAREDLDIACQREVMEETGIETDFVGILSFRHLHNSLHGKSDLFFICLMNPKTIKITKEDTEIAACEWIDVEMYSRQRKIVEHPVYSLLATFVERVAKDKNRKKYLDQTIVGTTAFYFPASAENETL